METHWFDRDKTQMLPLFFLTCRCCLLMPAAHSFGFFRNGGLHLLFLSPHSFITPLVPQPHSVAWLRFCVMWIHGSNQLVIPLWFSSVAVTLPGPGWLLPLLRVLRDCRITVTVCQGETLLGQQSCCHKKSLMHSATPNQTWCGRCCHLSSTAGRMARRQMSM